MCANRIDLDELRKVMKNLGEYVDEVKLKQVMVDGDKDGAIKLCSVVWASWHCVQVFI